MASDPRSGGEADCRQPVVLFPLRSQTIERKKKRTGAEEESGDVGCAAVTMLRHQQQTTP